MVKPPGLKIDYDQDARNKRNTALDLGLYEKFYAIGPRKAEVESESQMFARLKAESSGAATKSRAPPAAKAKEKGGALGAKIQIKSKDAKDAKAAGGEVESKSGASGALVQYSSDSEEEEEQNMKRAKTDHD